MRLFIFLRDSFYWAKLFPLVYYGIKIVPILLAHCSIFRTGKYIHVFMKISVGLKRKGFKDMVDYIEIGQRVELYSLIIGLRNIIEHLNPLIAD